MGSRMMDREWPKFRREYGRVDRNSEQKIADVRKDRWSLHEEAVSKTVVRYSEFQPLVLVVTVTASLPVTERLEEKQSQRRQERRKIACLELLTALLSCGQE